MEVIVYFKDECLSITDDIVSVEDSIVLNEINIRCIPFTSEVSLSYVLTTMDIHINEFPNTLCLTKAKQLLIVQRFSFSKIYDTLSTFSGDRSFKDWYFSTYFAKDTKKKKMFKTDIFIDTM